MYASFCLDMKEAAGLLALFTISNLRMPNRIPLRLSCRVVDNSNWRSQSKWSVAQFDSAVDRAKRIEILYKMTCDCRCPQGGDNGEELHVKVVQLMPHEFPVSRFPTAVFWQLSHVQKNKWPKRERKRNVQNAEQKTKLAAKPANMPKCEKCLCIASPQANWLACDCFSLHTNNPAPSPGLQSLHCRQHCCQASL